MGLFLTLDDLVAEEVFAADKGNNRIGVQRVFDLHCDTLDRLAFYGDSSVPGGFAQHDAGIPAVRMNSLANNDAQVSLDCMEAFAWCQCFAAFIPDVVHGREAWMLLERVRDVWMRELDRHADRLVRVRTVSGIDTAHAAGKVAGLFTVEGASFLEDDGTAEERLDKLAELGVRMVTLTWNARNALGSGNDTADGLTAFGRVCVRELERRGVVADVSHLNEKGFRDICDTATRPFVASHSNARAVCDHPRNLADWQLREIADRKGIVGLNFCTDFLSATHSDPTYDDVLRHVDHLLNVTGEDVLALGSDFDGCEVPTWLSSCGKIGNLYDVLVPQFGKDIATKVFFDNAYAFFERSESC